MLISVREALFNVYIYIYSISIYIIYTRNLLFSASFFLASFFAVFLHCMDLPWSPACKRQKYRVLCSFHLKISVKSVEVIKAGEAMHFWKCLAVPSA